MAEDSAAPIFAQVDLVQVLALSQIRRYTLELVPAQVHDGQLLQVSNAPAIGLRSRG